MAKKTIIHYSDEQKRLLAKDTERRYEANKTQMLTFEDWKCHFLDILQKQPKDFNVMPVNFEKEIRIAKPTKELAAILKSKEAEISRIKMTEPPSKQDFLITKLLKEAFEPELVIYRPEGFKVPGKRKDKGTVSDVEVPVWFNSSLKGINLRMGYANLDSATPGAMRLDDSTVHGMLGGATGAGKSVALHTIIASALHEYSPWELECYLLDLKIVELSKYVNRIKTPHVKFVGATGSTEYVMSVLDALKDEMNTRNIIFQACSISNLKEFREKFNLVMPRVVLIVDEFVQLFENLKDAEQAGCTDTEEQKAAINSAISSIARLGRSTGVHMLLSSQNMDGTLDDQTIGQFKGGASVYASAGVSKSLIGNDAAVRIVGKGKGIVTSNKQANDNEQLNVNTRIPFINSEISEEDAAAGKLPYLQETLVNLRQLADEVKWDRPINFYNENEVIPYAYFEQDLKYGTQKEENPCLENEISDELFKQQITKVIVLGREVKYSQIGLATIELKMTTGHSIVVAGTNDEDRIYTMQLLIENFKDPKFSHTVVVGDPAVFKMSGIENKISDIQVIKKKELPKNIYANYKTRKQLDEISTIVSDRCGGFWDTAEVFSELFEGRMLDTSDEVLGVCARLFEAFDNDEEIMDNDINQMFADAGIDDYDIPKYTSLLYDYYGTYSLLKDMTSDFTTEFNKSMFPKRIVWFFGMDNFVDVRDLDSKDMYRELINDGPTYGIHVIVTAVYWDKIAQILDTAEFILERCQKTFFMDMGLTTKVNINPNSIQLLTRQTKIQSPIRKYQII